MWELDHKESWALKNWCFWIVVLDKTLESHLDCKEIKPVHPKGNQYWIFIGRTDAKAEAPILWPPKWRSDSFKKTLMLGKIEGRRRRGWWDEMVGWYHQLNEHEFEQALEAGDGQLLQSMGSQRVRHGWVTELNWGSLCSRESVGTGL